MSLQIEYLPITDLKPYENNARHHEDEDVSAIVNSIKEFGFDDPIGVWGGENTIIEGHGRLMAAKKLKMKEVPVIHLDHLTDEQRRAYALAHNKTAELSEWDFDLLSDELGSIIDIDMSEFGFELGENDFLYPDGVAGSLREDYVVPPFSVLNVRERSWQDRKKVWLDLGIDSGKGRGESLMSGSMGKLAKAQGMGVTGTSVFDPVLCEIMYKWFNVNGGSIYDCFAGGSVRGIVAGYLGYQYTGIDLRQEQIDENRHNLEQIESVEVNPVWICDDSTNADDYIEDNSVDMVFSCPPYADLEKYSDDPRDISNMDYEDFITAYTSIINVALRKLKQDRFAVFVVGDIRDKKGLYRGFTDDTKKIFKDAGLKLYNDMILVEPIGTGAIRARNSFNNGRKVVKCHQNVLVFYKGDPKKIKDNYTEIINTDFDDLTEEDRG